MSPSSRACVRSVSGDPSAGAGLAGGDGSAKGESLPLAAVNVVLGCAAIIGLYLFPMYLVGHWHVRAAVCLGVAVAAGVGLIFTWYRRLPPHEPVAAADQASRDS